MRPPHGDALLVNPAQPQRLRLMPALNIGAAEVDAALVLLDAAQRVIASSDDTHIPPGAVYSLRNYWHSKFP